MNIISRKVYIYINMYKLICNNYIHIILFNEILLTLMKFYNKINNYNINEYVVGHVYSEVNR